MHAAGHGVWGMPALDARAGGLHTLFTFHPVFLLYRVAAKALKAGKHVFQEKPVGPTISEVSTALNTYRNAGDMPLWAVAENYRCRSLAVCWAAWAHAAKCIPDVPVCCSEQVQRGSQEKCRGAEQQIHHCMRQHG